MSRRAAAIMTRLSALELDPSQREYARFNSARYARLLVDVGELLDRMPESQRVRPTILDIGPAYQTWLLRDAFPAATVNSLGYRNPIAAPREGSERHFDFDLNWVHDETRWPHLPQHDIVVMAEVIEHLSTSPLKLFQCIATWVAPGGWLLIQTPNALALAKRLRALVGRNPLGGVAELTAGSHNPGHVREYTTSELAELGSAVGFDEIEPWIGNYFLYQGFAGRVYRSVTAILPRGMRQGITIRMRKPA